MRNTKRPVNSEHMRRYVNDKSGWHASKFIMLRSHRTDPTRLVVSRRSGGVIGYYCPSTGAVSCGKLTWPLSAF